MYNAKRDGYGNGANLAIPSMGEIEGRITVLEVVAMTSLSLLVKTVTNMQPNRRCQLFAVRCG